MAVSICSQSPASWGRCVHGRIDLLSVSSFMRKTCYCKSYHLKGLFLPFKILYVSCFHIWFDTSQFMLICVHRGHGLSTFKELQQQKNSDDATMPIWRFRISWCSKAECFYSSLMFNLLIRHRNIVQKGDCTVLQSRSANHIKPLAMLTAPSLCVCVQSKVIIYMADE